MGGARGGVKDRGSGVPAGAAVEAGHSLIAGHARTVTSSPARLAVALVVGHRFRVFPGGNLVTLAVSAARLLVAVVNCIATEEQLHSNRITTA